MNILIVAPMQREKEAFESALAQFGDIRHHYDIISTGVGKVNAALAVCNALRGECHCGEGCGCGEGCHCGEGCGCGKKEYDLVAVIGYAAASTQYAQGQIVAPAYAKYHDTQIGIEEPDLEDIYPLVGKDDCTILTGDVFVTDSLASKLSGKGERHLYDMEATAVAQTLRKLEVKAPLLVIKMISDIPEADHCGMESFYDFVCNHRDFTPFLEYIEEICVSL